MTLLNLGLLNIHMGMSPLSVFFQVVAAVVFTAAGEMELGLAKVEKGVKAFDKEEWVGRVSRILVKFLVLVVLVGVVALVGVEGVVEGIPGGAVGNL